MTKKEATAQPTLKVPTENWYATGKRKCAIAKVWLFQGKGSISVNDKDISEYIKREILVNYIKAPLLKLNLLNKYSIVAHVLGGGESGQAGALRLGIARALLNLNEEFKSALRIEGFLTRDARIKERKKYGCKRARKGFQFRKR